MPSTMLSGTVLPPIPACLQGERTMDMDQPLCERTTPAVDVQG